MRVFTLPHGIEDSDHCDPAYRSEARVILLTTILFFASGVAALLYQIAWQRALFAWYGVDLDAISIIASVFMLGLGTGAMIGGWLADRFHRKRILIFSLIEMTMGGFGLCSLDIIDRIGTTFVATSLPRLIALSFLPGQGRGRKPHGRPPLAAARAGRGPGSRSPALRSLRRFPAGRWRISAT
jgi:MFS family permease